MITTFIGDDMERSEAARQWLRTYTTGRPCKNGHNTYRYTQSGTCSQCVNNTVTRPDDQSFCILKVRVWKRDVDQVNAAMHLAMMLRIPGITMNEITNRGKYTRIIGTSAILHYLAHKDDVVALTKYAADLFKASKAPLDMSIVEERHKKASISNPLPEWKP